MTMFRSVLVSFLSRGLVNTPLGASAGLIDYFLCTSSTPGEFLRLQALVPKTWLP